MNEPYIQYSEEQNSYVIYRDIDMFSSVAIYSHHNEDLIRSMLEEIKARDSSSIIYEDWYESSFNK